MTALSNCTATSQAQGEIISPSENVSDLQCGCITK